MRIDKRILNFLVIIVLTTSTFLWTFFIFHMSFDYMLVGSVILIRMISSFFILNDYSISWSKVSQKTFLIKSFVYITAFLVYLPIFYGHVRFSFLVSELFCIYLLLIFLCIFITIL